MTREIVTLQIGNYSNNVGVHLWNQLDIEQTHNNTLIDYNTYYTFNKKTNVPSPRVLIIDYRNTFGYLLDENETNINSATNNPSIEIIKRPIETTFWSNKLKTKAKFHPKSLIPLSDYWYTPNKEENQFDIYPIGQQIYKKMFDQIDHSLHYLLESCDSLQSFRCLYDVNNSFSGLFTSIQDYLHDECPKQPMWSFGLGDQSSELNLLLSLMHSVNENQMPTIVPSLNSCDTYELGLAIQQSLISSTISLDLLADRLCPMKKHFLNLLAKIPLELNHKTLFQYLENNPDKLFELNHPIACHYFLRGIEQKQLYNRSLYNFNIQTSGDLISTYLREQYGSKMFVSTDSWIEKYDNMSILTGLINDDDYSFEFFDKLVRKMKKMNYKVLSKRWQENDFDEQMFEQLTNDLNTLHEQYNLNKSE
jgi:hypothetical protein